MENLGHQPNSHEKIIDTHVHVWDLNQLSLPWLNGVEALNKSYTTNDYHHALKKHGVEKAIYIEVDTDKKDKDKENALVFGYCAEKTCALEGAIVACHLEDSNAKSLIDKCAKNPHFKGVRRPLHVGDAPKGLCLQKQFIENLQYLGDKGFVFEACIRSEEITDLIEAAKKAPQTTFILDHIGNVSEEVLSLSKEKMLEHPWIKNLKKFSALNNTVCKISTLNVAFSEKKMEGVKNLLEICFDFFGENRLIFGSNWPVSEIFLGVDRWTKIVKEFLSKKGKTATEKALYKNAERVYQL